MLTLAERRVDPVERQLGVQFRAGRARPAVRRPGGHEVGVVAEVVAWVDMPVLGGDHEGVVALPHHLGNGDGNVVAALDAQ
jgi:hypothetical protein